MIGIATGATLIWLAARLTNRALHDEISANETVAEHLLMMLSLRGALLRVSASSDWGRSRLVQLLDRYRQLGRGGEDHHLSSHPAAVPGHPA